MKKRFATRIYALAMALCMVCAMTTGAFATNVATSSGGSATSNLTLSSTDDGTLTGAPAPTAMSVTVPTALPMAVGTDGSVTTATDAKIVNNSFGAVKVSNVTITGANGWTLTAFGTKDTLAAEKVDSNKFGFSITIGGGTALNTDTSAPDTQTLLSTADTGCYMSGVGDPANNSVAISYDAIVTAVSAAVTNASIASVVFIIEWDT